MKHDAWLGLYRLLKGIGFGQPEVPVVLPGSNAELPIGWTDLEMALTLGNEEADAARKFERAGWIVVAIPVSSMEASGPLLAFLDSLARAKLIAKSEREAKQSVSKTEEKLLKALLAAGLPEPDRNLEFRDASGRTITVPDFAWRNEKLAVYVDGHWYHGGKELAESLRGQVEDDPQLQKDIQERARNTASRDNIKRRAITKMGWAIHAVSDTEIDDDVTQAVADIKDTWEALHAKLVEGEPTE